MIDLEMLVKNETIADVACALAGTGGEKVLSYIFLDRIYTKYKPVVHETPEFRKAVR